MAAIRGAATIHYGEDFVEAKLENHGTFRTTSEGFKLARKRYIKAALLQAVAGIYEGTEHASKTYWRQYPTDVLLVVVADCQNLHFPNNR